MPAPNDQQPEPPERDATGYAETMNERPERGDALKASPGPTLLLT